MRFCLFCGKKEEDVGFFVVVDSRCASNIRICDQCVDDIAETAQSIREQNCEILKAKLGQQNKKYAIV